MKEVKNTLAHLNASKVHEIGDQRFVVVPEGHHVKELNLNRDAPLRIEEKRKLLDEKSFVDYVDEFSNENTAVFADSERSVFQAVIDHHGKGNPKYGCHTASLLCKKSKEWQVWENYDGSKQNQQDFAEFLEERAKEIVEPAGADILEIVSNFSVSREMNFSSAKRLQTGEFQFTYSEENQKGTVELPQEITIGVAPFHNGEKYQLKARLRYSLREGSLKLSYHLNEPHLVIEDAFNEITERLVEALPTVSVYKASC